MHFVFLLFLFSPPQVFSDNPSWWKEELANNRNPFEPEKTEPQSNNQPPCVCVRPHSCSESGSIITDGFGLINPRSGTPCKSGFVCCIPPDSTSSEEVTVNEANSDDYINLAEVESSQSGDETNEFSQVIPQPTDDANQEFNTCGDRPYEPAIIDKVSGNTDETETYAGDFPWMLLLFYEDPALEKIGGASLIHPQVALTVAHNVIGKDYGKITVRGAEFDLSMADETFTQDVRVKNIIMHPKYQRRPPENDIAVIILERPFKLTETLRTICLPPKNSNLVWKTCFVTGWGATGNADAPISQKLRKADMSIVPRDVCREVLIKNGLRSSFKLHESFICAGSNSTADSCQGDGGGPLQCQTSDSRYFHLVGITAWGLGCGRKGVPGAYSDVSYFIDFIENTLIDEKIHVNEIPKI